MTANEFQLPLEESGAITPIRVLIADDQQLIRAGFTMVINSQPDLDVVGEASDGLQAIRFVQSHPVDVVLMDVRMPQLDGLAATEQITAAFPDGTGPKVVMLTTFDLDEYVLRAIRGGASGFLLKDAPPEEMLHAIRSVHAGDAILAPSSTKRLIEHLAATLPDTERTPATVLNSLTDREREVLMLIARGHTNTEIGAQLYVAEATVKTHVGRILAKLNARDRVQVVVIAYETGLIAPGR